MDSNGVIVCVTVIDVGGDTAAFDMNAVSAIYETSLQSRRANAATDDTVVFSTSKFTATISLFPKFALLLLVNIEVFCRGSWTLARSEVISS